MASFRILLFLHIASVIALGATFAYPFIQALAERQGAGVTRFALQAIKRTNMYFVHPAMVLIFVFGLGLIFSDQTGYKDDMPVWLTIAIVWYLAAVGIAVFVLRLVRTESGRERTSRTSYVKNGRIRQTMIPNQCCYHRVAPIDLNRASQVGRPCRFRHHVVPSLGGILRRFAAVPN